MNTNTCLPIANAAVTLWHCDALGIYSHYVQASQSAQYSKTDNQTFLRGKINYSSHTFYHSSIILK